MKLVLAIFIFAVFGCMGVNTVRVCGVKDGEPMAKCSVGFYNERAQLVTTGHNIEDADEIVVRSFQGFEDHLEPNMTKLKFDVVGIKSDFSGKVCYAKPEPGNWVTVSSYGTISRARVVDVLRSTFTLTDNPARAYCGSVVTSGGCILGVVRMRLKNGRLLAVKL